MKEVCHCQYEQAIAEQEYQLVQQQIHSHISLKEPCQYASFIQSNLLTSIQNRDQQKQLLNEYVTMAEQAQNKLFELYLKSVEEQRDEYKKKLSLYELKFNDKEQRLSSDMIEHIHRRCQKISERIQYIYQYKAQTISTFI